MHSQRPIIEVQKLYYDRVLVKSHPWPLVLLIKLFKLIQIKLKVFFGIGLYMTGMGWHLIMLLDLVSEHPLELQNSILDALDHLLS